MDKDRIKKGIEAYKNQQNVLLRLIRKTKGLTESKFDELFQSREFVRRVRFNKFGVNGDAFLLGMGVNGGTLWAETIELLQNMIAIDLVDTKYNDNNEIVYVLPKQGGVQ